MIAYERTKWVAKSPKGYVYVAMDNLCSFDIDLERATRFDSPRLAKNAVLAAAILERINGRPVPVIVYERIKETVHIDDVEQDIWDANERTTKLLMVRDVSRSVADAYQWIMTSRDLDYRDWNCAVLLPEWEFTDPDEDTVQERLEKINLSAIISKRTIFLKREEDFVAMRLLFEDMNLCMSLEDGTILLDNRS